MPPTPELDPTARGKGAGGMSAEAGEADLPKGEARARNFARGNAPRFFRTRFTGFHIMFRDLDISEPWHMLLALPVVAAFSSLVTVLFFMMQRYETRAVARRRRRWAAGAVFALRLLFLYCLVLLVEVMNVWVIVAVAFGHMSGWLLYFIYIRDCLDGAAARGGHGPGGDDGEGGDDGKGAHLDDITVSSDTSSVAPTRNFWDLA